MTINNLSKLCKLCSEVKEDTNYYSSRINKDKLTDICKECMTYYNIKESNV